MRAFWLKDTLVQSLSLKVARSSLRRPISTILRPLGPEVASLVPFCLKQVSLTPLCLKHVSFVPFCLKRVSLAPFCLKRVSSFPRTLLFKASFPRILLLKASFPRTLLHKANQTGPKQDKTRQKLTARETYKRYKGTTIDNKRATTKNTFWYEHQNTSMNHSLTQLILKNNN